jgi:type 1 glutamine amidotransferase
MNMHRIISSVVALSVLGTAELPAQSPPQLEAVEAALPAAPTVPPRAPRKILLFSLCQGAVHEIVPLAEKTFVKMGEKSGAFTAVPSNRMEVFDPAVLREYDAILFNNTTQLKFENPAHRAALVEYVRGGKGLIGIHAATDNFYDFPEAAELIGGIFDGHPWNADGTWAVKLDDRDHPVNRAFGGRNFSISDEIYEFRGPYSRDTHRVLLSLDLERRRISGPRWKRTDNDTPFPGSSAAGRDGCSTARSDTIPPSIGTPRCCSISSTASSTPSGIWRRTTPHPPPRRA